MSKIILTKQKYMEKVIKKAIEGGYMKGDIEINNDGLWLSNSDKTLHQSDILLDPIFWECLGNSLGWNKYPVCRRHGLSECYKDNCFEGYIAEWLYRQHLFIDHIASGGGVDEFFKELLTKK